LQVRGLWAASQIAPDPGRLWILGRSGGFAAGIERLAWAVIKAVILTAVSLWLIRDQWTALQTLSEQELPDMAAAAGQSLFRASMVLGVVLLVLGATDYVLRYLRFEAMLRTTPEEQREDQRVMEGDLNLRSKRRRLARAWRGDAPELLAGASLMIAGTGGLTVVLAGGPPPRRTTVRTLAQGSAGAQLRRLVDARRLPRIDAPELARRLALHAATEARSSVPVPPELVRELATAWPAV
jgi:flagellar biosynthetic protein FlhB